ncbi:MAG: hypothetical protein C4537_04405 [Acholeplasma sp.]|nr:MAG: hypothetical protein C4537_04405 [Acholeplasma sp.]
MFSDFEKIYVISKLESYLMEHMYGGIPLVRSTDVMLFSDRVDLPTNEYVYNLGYSIPSLTLTEDDSNVFFDAETYGHPLEYTFRTYYTEEQDNLNTWINVPGKPAPLYDLLSGTLYQRIYNEEAEVMNYILSLAGSFPVAIGDDMSSDGKSTSWKITLKDQLEWYIPEELTVNDSSITAEDFVWTMKEALENNWLGTCHGTFALCLSGIKNIENYREGNSSIDDIGIKVSNSSDLTLEIEFESPVNMNHVLGLFSDPFITPIHQEAYEILGDDYATSVETTPSIGLFRLSSWIYEDSMLFIKNDNHPNAATISLDKIYYRYFDDLNFKIDEEGIYQAFLSGELDMSYVPNAHLNEQTWNTPYMFESSPTVWRLGINSLGTNDRREQFKEEYPDIAINMDYDLEPILMYDDMRQALYFGIDRLSLTNHMTLGYIPENRLISSQYALDPSQVPYRSELLVSSHDDDYLQDTYGYDPDRAKAHFLEAISLAIHDGYYVAGTENSETIIELLLYYSSGGRASIVEMMENLESLYEAVLIDNEHHIKVDIVLFDVAFPSSYINPNIVQSGAYDLYFGGITGGLYDLANYMTIFSLNESNDLALSIGIDTSSPAIELSYNDIQGNTHHEFFSYDALLSSLLGVTYILDGDIQKDYDDAQSAISATYDMQGEIVDEITLNNNMLQAYTGKENAYYANIIDVDHVFGYLVEFNDDSKAFVIVSETEGRYQVYDQIKLFSSIEDTIQNYVANNFGPYYELTDVTPMLTDLDVQNHPYLQTYYDFTTLSSIASEYEVSLNYLRVYSTTWYWSNGTLWTDVFLVIEVDGYYIPLDWL